MNGGVVSRPARDVLLDDVRFLEHPQPTEYIDYPVDVPVGATGVEVQLKFTKVTGYFQLYASLLDPSGVLRGHVQCPKGPGPHFNSFWIRETSSSPGCIKGPIPPGRWTVRIDFDRLRESGQYHLKAFLEHGRPEADVVESDRRVSGARQMHDYLRESSGQESSWLKGELHCHSVHSDGQNSVADIVDEVRRLDLDFFALSDHFTWSHWSELAEIQSSVGHPLTLIPSIEATTHKGHANLHGLVRWPNVYVDGEGWSGEDLVAEVHSQGGLFGVNHPFGGQQAWRRPDVSWENVDVLEVFNESELENNVAAIGLWDRLLAQGYDISPVAGTDCHDIHNEARPLGLVFTYVKASGRSVAAIIAGLRAGATVISRGALVDFHIRLGSTIASLGERIVVGSSPVQLEIEVDSKEPCTLYVMRDGLMWHQSDIDAGPRLIVIDDLSPISGAYRVELHRRAPALKYQASAFRSYESFEALTSFIRVVAEDVAGASARNAIEEAAIESRSGS